MSKQLMRTVQVCLPVEVAEQLAELARQVGSTPSGIARAIITATLEDDERAPDPTPTFMREALGG